MGLNAEKNPQRGAAAAAGLALLACSLIAACSDPYADARAALTPSERERFDRGARAAAPCAACHDLAGKTMKVGPPLRGLEGRKAGSLVGFGYSAALQRSGVVWSERTLDAFLASRGTYIPGNRMVAPGVSDATRGDLVFFLLRAGDAP